MRKKLGRLFLLPGLSLLIFALWATPSLAQEIKVAAAASLRQALPEIVEAFVASQPDTRVTVRFGASGTLARQLERGAPDHLFLSADAGFADRLVKTGLTRGEGSVYAKGRLALFRPVSSPVPESTNLGDLASLVDDGSLQRLGLAQPEHAPYGRAAKVALEQAGSWQALQAHIVLGESVGQTAQFAAAGTVDLALISVSLAMALAEQGRGDWRGVATQAGESLEQKAVVMVGAPAMADALLAFLSGGEVAEILKAHGYQQGGA